MITVNFFEVLRESFTLIILLFCSIFCLTFAIERWLYYRKVDIDTGSFLAKTSQLVEQGQFKEAQEFCEKTPGPVSAVVKAAIVNHQKKKEDIEDILHVIRMEERFKLERFLIILGTMGNTAPFIGLFGTVVGIIKAFRDLAASGTGGPTVVARGIAEALVATAAGLAVAIPAVIFYNYYMKRVKMMVSRMEAATVKILGSLRT